jgi:hypothetical protein
MEQKIGETAGTVWHYLQKHGKTSITKLVSDVSFEAKVEKNIIYMAVGWLARENKLNFSCDRVERKCMLWLK